MRRDGQGHGPWAMISEVRVGRGRDESWGEEWEEEGSREETEGEGVRCKLARSTTYSILTFVIVGIQLSFSSRHLSATSKTNEHPSNVST